MTFSHVSQFLFNFWIVVCLAVCIPHGKSCTFAVPLQVLYIAQVLFMLLAILLLWKIYSMQISVKFCTGMSSIYSIFWKVFLLSDRIVQKKKHSRQGKVYPGNYPCENVSFTIQHPTEAKMLIRGFPTLIICVLLQKIPTIYCHLLPCRMIPSIVWR